MEDEVRHVDGEFTEPNEAQALNRLTSRQPTVWPWRRPKPEVKSGKLVAVVSRDRAYELLVTCGSHQHSAVEARRTLIELTGAPLDGDLIGVELENGVVLMRDYKGNFVLVGQDDEGMDVLELL